MLTRYVLGGPESGEEAACEGHDGAHAAERALRSSHPVSPPFALRLHVSTLSPRTYPMHVAPGPSSPLHVRATLSDWSQPGVEEAARAAAAAHAAGHSRRGVLDDLQAAEALFDEQHPESSAHRAGHDAAEHGAASPQSPQGRDAISEGLRRRVRGALERAWASAGRTGERGVHRAQEAEARIYALAQSK